MPIGEDGYFFQPLWTSFSPTDPNPGILDWYTVLIGLLALSTLVSHGANFIAVKTEHELNVRSRRISRLGWISTLALTIIATVATFYLRPGMLSDFAERPYGLVLPLLASADSHEWATSTSRSGTRRLSHLQRLHPRHKTNTVFAIYPEVLPAVDPANSLTIYNASASPYGLAVGLVWWSIGMVLAAVYFILIYRLFRGKVRLDDEGY